MLSRHAKSAWPDARKYDPWIVGHDPAVSQLDGWWTMPHPWAGDGAGEEACEGALLAQGSGRAVQEPARLPLPLSVTATAISVTETTAHSSAAACPIPRCCCSRKAKRPGNCLLVRCGGRASRCGRPRTASRGGMCSSSASLLKVSRSVVSSGSVPVSSCPMDARASSSHRLRLTATPAPDRRMRSLRTARNAIPNADEESP